MPQDDDSAPSPGAAPGSFLTASAARVLFLVAVTGFFAIALAARVGKELDLYRTPYAEALPWGAGGEALSRRVVLCLVDGLRDDVSLELPELNALRARGADVVLEVTEPSASIPLSHVIATGAPQQTIGMLTNAGARLAGPGWYRTFGTIYTAAHERGLRTGNVVTWGPGYALEGFLDAPNTLKGTSGYDDDDVVLPRVLEVLREDPPVNLLWVHWDVVDRAGHNAGGASQKYREMAQLTAARLAAVAEALDFERDTLIITADHGHLDAGGHMGHEPEVAAVPCILVGAGIRPGVQSTARQIDLASTVSILLGSPIPTHNEGWPIDEVLTTPPELRARRAYDVAAQRLGAYRLRMKRIGATDPELEKGAEGRLSLVPVESALAAGDWEHAYAGASNMMLELELRWWDFLVIRGSKHVYPRVTGALGLLAIGLAVSIVHRRGKADRSPVANPPAWLLVGVVFLVLTPPGLYYLTGHTYSMSWIGRKGIAAFAGPRLVEGAVGLLFSYVIARLLAARSTMTAPVPFGGVLAGIAGGAAVVVLIAGSAFLVGRGVVPQPWQDSYDAIAFISTEAMHFLPIAAVCFIASIVVAARTARANAG